MPFIKTNGIRFKVSAASGNTAGSIGAGAGSAAGGGEGRLRDSSIWSSPGKTAAKDVGKVAGAPERAVSGRQVRAGISAANGTSSRTEARDQRARRPRRAGRSPWISSKFSCTAARTSWRLVRSVAVIDSPSLVCQCSSVATSSSG